MVLNDRSPDSPDLWLAPPPFPGRPHALVRAASIAPGSGVRRHSHHGYRRAIGGVDDAQPSGSGANLMRPCRRHSVDHEYTNGALVADSRDAMRIKDEPMYVSMPDFRRTTEEL